MSIMMVYSWHYHDDPGSSWGLLLSNSLFCSMAWHTAKLLHKLAEMNVMKKFSYVWLCALAMAMSLTSCQAIGDIFKAGMWFGIIIVVGIIVLILWLVGRSRK